MAVNHWLCIFIYREWVVSILFLKVGHVKIGHVVWNHYWLCQRIRLLDYLRLLCLMFECGLGILLQTSRKQENWRKWILFQERLWLCCSIIYRSHWWEAVIDASVKKRVFWCVINVFFIEDVVNIASYFMWHLLVGTAIACIDEIVFILWWLSPYNFCSITAFRLTTIHEKCIKVSI